MGSFEIYRKFDGSTLKVERQTVHISDDTGRIAMFENRTFGDARDDNETERELVRYIYSNHLQSASLELNDKANIISYEEYHPYGTTSYQAMNASIKATAKRYRYTGKERDEESGLYYHGARYYIPWLARWLSPDPINNENYNLDKGYGLEKNLERDFLELTASSYEYAYDNPIMYNDPSGEQPPIKDRFPIHQRETYDQPKNQFNFLPEIKEINGITPLEGAILANHVCEVNVDNKNKIKKGKELELNGWKLSDRIILGVDYREDESDFNSALYERVMDNGKIEYAYVTQGTNAEKKKDWKNNIAQVINGQSAQYTLSLRNAGLIDKALKGEKLTFVGHSLGGGMASANSLLTGRNAFTFNPAGLSEKFKKNNPELIKRTGTIRAFIVKGEAVDLAQKTYNLTNPKNRIETVGKVTYLSPSLSDYLISGGTGIFSHSYFHTMGVVINAMKSAGFNNSTK